MDERQISTVTLRHLHRNMCHWWLHSGRDFPWRRTHDPYHILIAEMMLHRTQAIQVVPVYEDFLKNYPDVFALESAPLRRVYSLLKPLGLKWRAQNIGRIAKVLVRSFAGIVPDNEISLRSLPGVGPYVAGAVLCFAYGKAVPLIDANTVRIIARLFNIPRADGLRRRKFMKQLMGRIVDSDHARAYHLTLLDLGALVCHESRPVCEKCPLLEFCAYGQNMMMDRYPKSMALELRAPASKAVKMAPGKRK